MRANSPTVRTTIRSRAISPGGFDFHFAPETLADRGGDNANRCGLFGEPRSWLCVGASWGGGEMRAHLLLATTVVAAALLAATSSTRAQTNWTGAISSDWFTPGNWSAGVPTGGLTVIDTVTPNAPVVGAAGATAQLVVGFSRTGALTIGGGGTVNSSSIIVGVSGTGTLRIANGGTVNSGEFVLAPFAGSIGTLNIGANPNSAPNPPTPLTAPGTLNTA